MKTIVLASVALFGALASGCVERPCRVICHRGDERPCPYYGCYR